MIHPFRFAPFNCNQFHFIFSVRANARPSSVGEVQRGLHVGEHTALGMHCNKKDSANRKKIARAISRKRANMKEAWQHKRCKQEECQVLGGFSLFRKKWTNFVQKNVNKTEPRVTTAQPIRNLASHVFKCPSPLIPWCSPPHDPAPTHPPLLRFDTFT